MYEATQSVPILPNLSDVGSALMEAFDLQRDVGDEFCNDANPVLQKSDIVLLGD
jgi:hypothetical protein